MSFLRLAVIVLALLAGCSRADDGSVEAKRVSAQIRAEAAAAHPGDPVAVDQAVNEAVERRVSQVGESSDPREAAAAAFLGYYTKHVFGIPAVCRENGIDIEAYSAAFAEENAAALRSAAAVVNAQSLIARARLGINDAARIEVGQVASVRKTDQKGACTFIAQNSRQLAIGGKFSAIMPKLYAQFASP